MFLPLTIAPAVLDTILGHIAPHFLKCTAGNFPAACDAAGSMLTGYHVETEEELRLAAEIVSFGFHALEALSEATAPDLSPNATLRLRGGAVSLSREGHKCQRKLDQLQRARLRARLPEVDLPAGVNHPLKQRERELDGSNLKLSSLRLGAASPEATTPPPNPAPTQAPDLIEPTHDAREAPAKKGSVQNWKMSRQQRRAAEQITANPQRDKTKQSRQEAAATLTLLQRTNLSGAL